MEYDFLKKYSIQGSFLFHSDDRLPKACNAPGDSVGIYLVFDWNDELIYIGKSRTVLQDGTLRIRKGGLFARIVIESNLTSYGALLRNIKSTVQ